jgi:hypothetical protein
MFLEKAVESPAVARLTGRSGGAILAGMADGPAESGNDAVDEYRLYLERFDALVGTVEFGIYQKHKGRLIKKLTYDEFEAKLGEYREVDKAYNEILEHGDTINDVLVKVLRERSDELLMDRKV